MNINNNRNKKRGSSSNRPNKFSNNKRNDSQKRYGSSSSRPNKFSSNKRRGSNNSRPGKRGGRKMPTFDPSQFINQNPIETKIEIYEPKHTFADFGLNKQLVDTVLNLGISIPTPIQDQIIPEILNNRDVIGLAETGTGKTAAFLVPMIEKTKQDMKRQTLILTPTRELAIQVNEEFMKLSKGLGLFSTTCVGGMNIYHQIKSLKRTNHFIIGTPGRIMDLIKRKNLRIEKVTTVILDEADRMLDMGFINDMRTILSQVPKEHETLFFSATMSDEANKIVNDFLKNPVTISVKKRDVTNSVEQDVIRVRLDDKFKALTSLFTDESFKKVIIFGSMKHSVNKLAIQLSEFGIRSESIHGNKNHSQRQKSLRNFKEGHSKVLVATDVAARGIHIDDVSHVINYDLPNTFLDYVHRIGRTGRGSSKGKALTFIIR